jgi:hypothetical protein
MNMRPLVTQACAPRSACFASFCSREGQSWTPIGGQIWKPINKRRRESLQCKNAIYLLGEQLFELSGDTDAMVEIADSAAFRSKRYFSYRAGIINATWDGIGATKDSPGWCS